MEDNAFRRELLEQMEVGPAGRHFGQEVVKALEARAERMTRESMERMVLCEEDLAKTPKGDKASYSRAWAMFFALNTHIMSGLIRPVQLSGSLPQGSTLWQRPCEMLSSV